MVLCSSDADNNQSDDVTADDALSDLSDEDEYLYPDGEEGEQLKLIRLTPNRPTNLKIRNDFSNTDKVIIHLIQMISTSLNSRHF